MGGLVFGKYEKIRRLAEGGMGEVWLARQVASVKGFDRLVILKALKHDLAEEPGFVEQFLDEARVAATLNHPCIVALFEVGEWDGTFFIAMEYIAGDDLSRLWYAAAKRGVGLPFQVSVKIVHDAALALDHAHHATDVHHQPLHIVHRDVSPQNIMVRADGVTKLVDFGIAKAANRVSITKTGTVKGKLQYMSPEQVRGETVDARSDQFSLGIVLWEMCTGKRLFKGDSELVTLNKILQLPIPTPSSLVPGFPLELERVIQRMLERDRQRRYPRCSDVARELRAYLERASASNGEASVADFVEDILGEELRARTADLTPMLTGESRRLDGSDGGGRTEERPAQIRHTPAVLLKRHGDGQVRRFSEPRDLQQCILVGEVAREDLVSEDGERWRRIGDGEEYGRFFEVAEAARVVAEAAEQTLSARTGPRVEAEHILREPTTQSGEGDAMEDSLDADRALSTQPVPALVDDDDDDEEMPSSLPATRLEHDDGGAKTMPVAALLEDDDEDDDSLAFGTRRSGVRFVVAGMAVVLLLAAGAFVVVDEDVRARALGLAGRAAQPVVDEGAVFSALRRDRVDEVERELARVTTSYEEAQGRRRAKAAAFASMLASAQARQESGHALALALASGTSADEQSRAAAREAQRFRVTAYKLASEARTLAGDMPEAFLAMASYQAERAAAVEVDADLAGLERALEKSRRSDEARRALLEEAATQRALAAAAAAMLGKGDVEETAPAADTDGDVRLAWAASLLAAKRTEPKDADAARAVVAALKGDANDPRKRALTSWAAGPSTSGEDAVAGQEEREDEREHDGATKNGSTTAPKAADPPTADAVVAAAKRAQSAGKSFEAASLFRKATKLDPRRVDAWLGSGWAYIDLGKGDAAVRSFRRAASLPDAPPEAQFGLAEAYRFSGQKAQAIKAYERYLKQTPAGADASVAKNALEALKE